MTYCYTPIDSPAFFGGVGECGEPVAHDLDVVRGGLASDEQVATSAILIQLHTDARYNNQRGWWGDQFQPFPIGSRLWRVPEIGDFKLARVDEMIRAAMEPLITRDVIGDINIRTVRTIDGVEATVDALKNGRSLLRTSVNG